MSVRTFELDRRDSLFGLRAQARAADDRTDGTGVTAMNWQSPEQANKIIESLKKWRGRIAAAGASEVSPL
ncbi:MAG: hypothetical protein ACLQAT_16245 [Candidatus Binataceae bacterium]